MPKMAPRKPKEGPKATPSCYIHPSKFDVYLTFVVYIRFRPMLTPSLPSGPARNAELRQVRASPEVNINPLDALCFPGIRDSLNCQRFPEPRPWGRPILNPFPEIGIEGYWDV